MGLHHRGDPGSLHGACEREAGGSEEEMRSQTLGPKGRETLLALKVEEEALAKECGRLPEAQNRKEVDLPLELPERMQLCQHLDFRTSNFLNYKIIHLYCFKPLNL